MIERIEISVIPQDLRHEETIVQIAEALDNLDFAVSHIFNSINERILENTKRLGIIQTKAAKLQEQLNYLQTNLNLKAVKLYSAAKYPANHTYKEYKLVIQPKSRTEIPDTKICKSVVPILDKFDSMLIVNNKIENEQCANNINMQEKLQFYYVKSKPSKKINIHDVEKNQIKQNVSSIDSLLAFNMKDSRNYFNLQSAQTDEKNEIEDAPNSILQPWHSSEIESPTSYLYTPILGEVPEMNVPLMLPDLPGIVDDERFILDLNFQSPIAPSSAVVTPTIRHNPPILDTKEQKPNTSQFIEKASCKDQTISNIISTPINISQFSTEQSVVDISSKVYNIALTVPNVLPTIIPPPPPPPPLPPPLPFISSQEEKKKMDKEIKKSTLVNSNIVDDRSNLMAAIRDAGGVGRAKLKHTAPVDKAKDRWSSASVGGDLMADLHATLSLRRKGIAGSAINALVRMSSMIPPPPKPNESSTSDKNSVTSECESQDDDGWEE